MSVPLAEIANPPLLKTDQPGGEELSMFCAIHGFGTADVGVEMADVGLGTADAAWARKTLDNQLQIARATITWTTCRPVVLNIHFMRYSTVARSQAASDPHDHCLSE